jgi:hypothetical protein
MSRFSTKLNRVCEKGDVTSEFGTPWWAKGLRGIFLGCGAIAGLIAIGPAILAIIAAFCTFVVAPILVLASVSGNSQDGN